MDTTELAAEVAAIERRQDQRLVWMLRRKLHAIKVRQLVDRPNAVRMKCRMPPGHQTHHLNDRYRRVKPLAEAWMRQIDGTKQNHIDSSERICET